MDVGEGEVEVGAVEEVEAGLVVGIGIQGGIQTNKVNTRKV